MTSITAHRKDSRIYRKLISLTRQQLAAITVNVSRDARKWEKLLFLHRNIKFKSTILKLLTLKESRIGNDKKAVGEMMRELKAMETDDGEWSDVTREELDYIRIMVHGLRDIEDDGEEEPEEPLTYKLNIPDCN